MAWATCQGTHRVERTTPDLYKKVLGRSLGSHDDDIPVRERCNAGRHRPINRDRTPPCILGRMRTHRHETITKGVFAKAAKGCDAVDAVQSTLPLQESRGNDDDNLKMDVVANPDISLVRTPKHHTPAIDVTPANPCAPCALDASVGVDIPGSALGKAMSRKPQHYQGNSSTRVILHPFGFPTWGEHRLDVHRVLNGLAKRRTREICATFK